MKRNKHILFLALAMLGLLGVGYAGSSMFRQTHPAVVAVDKEKLVPIDTQLVAKFLKITSFIQALERKDLVAGSISITDGADSTQNVVNLPYRFEKTGTAVYCLFGRTETISSAGKYLYIDHGQQKMMLGSAQKNAITTTLPDFNKIIKNLQGEGYRISDEGIGNGLRKISLLNPNHIACRAYQITYREEELQPIKIFLQLDNFNEPLNPKLDRLMTFNIQTQPVKSSTSIPAINDFVVADNEGYYKAGAKYKAYELIQMP